LPVFAAAAGDSGGVVKDVDVGGGVALGVWEVAAPQHKTVRAMQSNAAFMKTFSNTPKALANQNAEGGWSIKTPKAVGQSKRRRRLVNQNAEGVD
jgi:hypothetical protein